MLHPEVLLLIADVDIGLGVDFWAAPIDAITAVQLIQLTVRRMDWLALWVMASGTSDLICLNRTSVFRGFLRVRLQEFQGKAAEKRLRQPQGDYLWNRMLLSLKWSKRHHVEGVYASGFHFFEWPSLKMVSFGLGSFFSDLNSSKIETALSDTAPKGTPTLNSPHLQLPKTHHNWLNQRVGFSNFPLILLIFNILPFVELLRLDAY